MCFVNKLDRMGADFYKAVDSIKDRLTTNIAVLQLPIGYECDFKGVVDLVNMKAIVWHDEELGAKFDIVDIPDDLADKAHEYHHELIDVVSHYDDVVLEKYLEDENSVTADDLKRAIRKATINDGLVPVLTGSAFKNKGVQPLLDAVVDYMPSPLDLPPTDGHGPEGQGGARAQGRRQRAVLGAGLQDRRRPARQAHLLPGLLGPAREGRGDLQLADRQEGAGRPHPADARQQPRGPRRRPRRRHRRRHRPQGHPHRRHALRRQGARSCSSRWCSPSR